jgi:hypothetical protein
MSNLRQYTTVRRCVADVGEPDTYTVHLKVGVQEFTIYPPYDDLDEAAFVQEMLCVALERIVKERREDPTW